MIIYYIQNDTGLGIASGTLQFTSSGTPPACKNENKVTHALL